MYAFSQKTIWSSRIDAGSEGRVFIDTGVTWIISENWATRLYASSKFFDYENGKQGDADWYMYDASESGVGLSISYLF
jgi:hypothetical protein